MRAKLIPSVVLSLVCIPCVAHAQNVINMTFSGIDTNPLITHGSNKYGPYTSTEGYLDYGTVSVGYSGADPATLTQSNISSFLLTRTIDLISTTIYTTTPSRDSVFDYAALGYKTTYTQDITQLSSLSITTLPDGTVNTLSIATDPVVPGGDYTYANGFDVSTAFPGDFTYYTTTASPSYASGEFTTGTVVPEPASAAMILVGGLGLLCRRRRAI